MQLTQLFPSLKKHTTYPLVQQPSTTLFFDALNHCWYEIKKQEISSRDALLLAQFLQRADKQNPWYLLLTQGIIPTNKTNATIRVLQYTTKNETAPLRDAMELFFLNDAILIEVSSQSAWIILFKEYSHAELESFIAILENDFYIQGQLFIGQPLKISHTLHTLFSMEQLVFQQIQNVQFQTIYTFASSVVYLFPRFLQQPVQHYLEHLIHDKFNKEMLETVTTLFMHHGNVSSAAKALHLHRNTLLYRIQRLSDEISLDLKQSEDLLIAYLAAQSVKLTNLSK